MRERIAGRVYYGWVVTAACFLAAAATFGVTYSFSVFFDALAGSFPVSEARVSLVFGVQTAVVYVGAAALGGALDRVGPRRLLAVGSVLLCGGLAGAAGAGSYLALLATYGLVTGLGMSCCYLVAYATVPRWFGRRRGFANGIASAGLGAGLLVVAPASNALIAAYGWRTAYLALAAGFAVVLAVAVVLVADDPDAVGADAAREFPDGRAADGSGGAVRDTVLSAPFALVVLGWIGVYATLYVLVNHVVRYADLAGMRWAGVAAVSTVGVTTSAARLGVGAASDRVGRVGVFVVCSALMGASLLALPLARTPAVLLAVAVAFGVGYGGNGALLSPLVADLFGNENLGSLYGVASVAFAVAGLAAPPLATLGYDRVGAYAPVFVATGAVGLAGAVCVALAGRLR